MKTIKIFLILSTYGSLCAFCGYLHGNDKTVQESANEIYIDRINELCKFKTKQLEIYMPIAIEKNAKK